MGTREYEVRSTLSIEEAARRIIQLGGQYDLEDKRFDVYDQLLACEAINEATPIQPSYNQEQSKENVVAYGNGNGGCKQLGNFELTPNKLEAISKLNKYNYRTSPLQIASMLEIIFAGCGTDEGWWLAVAQQWNPRAISRVLAYMVKQQAEGWCTYKNPAKYFTFLIKFHKKRKSVRLPMVPVNNSEKYE